MDVEEGLGLLAKGVRADTLVQVLGQFRGILDLYDWHVTCQTWLADIRGHMEPCSGAEVYKSAESDLTDALVAGRNTDGTQRTVFDDSYLALGQPGDHILVARLVGGHTDFERFDTDENAGWILHVMRITAGRRLAITKTGHVGLVPPSAKEGDDVVVLFGCSMPLLLRRNRTSNVRRVVGECYFRRMMDGQIVDAATCSADFETPLPSVFDEEETSPEQAALLTNMETLSALCPDPIPSEALSAQWFCIK